MAPRRNRTSAREIRRLKRRKEVYSLRLAGRNICDIAQQLQIGEATVKRDINVLMAAARDKMADRCQSELMLSLERLDQYQASFHDRAKGGDKEAVEVCLKVESQRARLLYPTTGNATAVNVNVGKSNDQPNAERDGIVVQFTPPDPSKWRDDPMPPSLPAPNMNGPRPMNRAEHADERYPHRVDATAEPPPPRAERPRHQPPSYEVPEGSPLGEASGRERVLPGGAIIRDNRQLKRQW